MWDIGVASYLTSASQSTSHGQINWHLLANNFYFQHQRIFFCFSEPLAINIECLSSLLLGIWPFMNIFQRALKKYQALQMSLKTTVPSQGYGKITFQGSVYKHWDEWLMWKCRKFKSLIKSLKNSRFWKKIDSKKKPYFIDPWYKRSSCHFTINHFLDDSCINPGANVNIDTKTNEFEIQSLL